ncbi:MAG TPA: bifunctional D-glycero-beta-D-manno-heptose-7-phosphate kinase/D-glycero-beta-D-manno-heptose 1-phosphate adenylyltransferase HldE [Pseudomonadales bacterium]|jgi:D-beta-D-heptose 7-phosphate kinase/D-beta-D-heptose 1-phosphate adenosyltransferase|nr:bifunctional D-glycero-beta-D-manno-heptose-7-phosphate kinase/D-glycero-beta-D-manno-heptose 1-phosphate adenylyltransferase HldE [Pseudomonadales bacterium]
MSNNEQWAVQPQFNSAQVLVVGDVMLDRYWHGATARISPEAPVPVVQVQQREDRAGGAGNVALNIAALGGGVSLLGLVGADEEARVLAQRLQAAQVHCDFETITSHPTITKLRVISRHQQLLRMDFEESFSAQDSAVLAERAVPLFAHVNVIVLSDYKKGALQSAPSMIAAARAANKTVLVDPKGTDFSCYRGATLLTPNLHEFEAVVGECKDEQTLVQKGMALIEALDLQALLVTRGEHGMTLLQRGEQQHPLHLPAQAREVFDVTGAGDTVIATLAASMAAGIALPQAVVLANIAAGIVVGKLGTATISGPELRQALRQAHGIGRGVMTEEQLLAAMDDARNHGEKIVFTNGCFDLLHPGHVTYLEDAKKLGQRLVVAVNSDASVKRLKGEGRPIQSAESRMAVLAGLEAVDWVVVFADDTPERLLQLLKPDVLVKGGDYTPEQVVGASIVRAYGGEVAVLSFVDQCSTTSIVKTILSRHSP